MEPQILFRGSIAGDTAGAQDVAVVEIPAGYFADGDVATLRLTGKNSNGSGGNVGMTLGFHIGSTPVTIASATAITDGNAEELTVLEYSIQRIGADLQISGKESGGDLGAAGDDYVTLTPSSFDEKITLTVQGTFGDTPDATCILALDAVHLTK